MIDYNEIDEGCIPMVKLFNRIGLTTEFCCQGHKENDGFYVIFDKTVKDQDIVNFLNSIKNQSYIVGSLYKWARRIGDEIWFNWKYEVKYFDYLKNKSLADVDYANLVKNFG